MTRTTGSVLQTYRRFWNALKPIADVSYCHVPPENILNRCFRAEFTRNSFKMFLEHFGGLHNALKGPANLATRLERFGGLPSMEGPCKFTNVFIRTFLRLD